MSDGSEVIGTIFSGFKVDRVGALRDELLSDTGLKCIFNQSRALSKVLVLVILG